MSEKQFSSDDPVNDPIYERFMQRQFGRRHGAGSAKAICCGCMFLRMAPPHFVAEFLCKGLIREDAGEIKEASEFQVGIWFPPDYLRRADPFEMLRLFTPHVWHPNVSRRTSADLHRAAYSGHDRWLTFFTSSSTSLPIRSTTPGRTTLNRTPAPGRGRTSTAFPSTAGP